MASQSSDAPSGASPLSASLEDYLEAIFSVTSEHQVARVRDLTAMLGVSASSVTGALRALGARGLINYTPYDVVTMTPEGTRRARGVAGRHSALRDFFVKVLNVDGETAETAACGMEHTVPAVIVERIGQLVDYAEANPAVLPTWPQTEGDAD